ncbi:255_t:CDS:1 [Diversispora eburnea]|uniref:255_t:CDS:1 n=1 Tax=Diversispora eburnea TaxID=1213867 RepID=A0A9N9BRP6_9GLOM|nr:255_t:CDS:1 [Diversispora eburnea]
MSTKIFFLSFVALLLCLPFGSTAPSDHTYYLSLGDSFAAGVEPISPNKSISPAFSYANALYDLLKKNYSNLKLIKYGCSGETSDGLINYNKCSKNPKYSQLNQAIDFMNSHRGMVKFVTINIGVNDLHKYCHDKDLDGKCGSKVLKNLSNNLIDVIIPKLKEAGGEGVQYAGSTYFHRFTNDLNDLSVKIYRENGFRVADIRSVFGTNGDPSEFKRRVCLYTNSCNKYNNSHPNVPGSREIGNLYHKELGPFN